MMAGKPSPGAYLPLGGDLSTDSEAPARGIAEDPFSSFFRLRPMADGDHMQIDNAGSSGRPAAPPPIMVDRSK